MTTTTIPFAIDWEAMLDARNGLLDDWSDAAEAHAYLTEYHRQLAAAGLVVVRRELLAQVPWLLAEALADPSTMGEDAA